MAVKSDVFLGDGSVYLVWVYFRLIRMKHRIYEEINLLLGLKIPARGFKSQTVHSYEGGLHGAESLLEKLTATQSVYLHKPIYRAVI
ncbi:hypothetical protein EDB81DRAFT_885146 [Dactylonectria macrodidyma]|uniref:Uncharacterized protein n=1 Tax=Dactylonectria macrodidyma TaxID=307937 RepID=A0A9P9ES27_9HYPO|nr:hypothetical protein EDB81DRAFT_885146 [Dactylonectria macrodidyma]